MVNQKIENYAQIVIGNLQEFTNKQKSAGGKGLVFYNMRVLIYIYKEIVDF